MDNIFDGAKFGDLYCHITSQCREDCAIYRNRYYDKKTKSYHHVLFTLTQKNIEEYDSNGICISTPICGLNIVSKYQEPIDEEKLDELARERYEGPLTWPQEYRGGEFAYKFVECFKEGYRKAKEE